MKDMPLSDECQNAKNCIYVYCVVVGSKCVYVSGYF